MKTKNKGQALTEFALILPILLLLILGIIEGARIIWAFVTVQNAAREAARYGVTGQPFDELANPWTLRPDRYAGCNPQFNDAGQLIYTPDLVNGGDCAGPNDRVDAIIGVALESGRGFVGDPNPDRYAIHPATFEATGYVDEGGVYGVRVFGQRADTNAEEVDYAGTEGLNVLVQVYYNVEMVDPLYAAIIPNGFVHLVGEVQMQNEGIDSVLGSLPPPGIDPPQAPEGGPYEPGEINPPIVLSLDGSTVDAGSDLRVKLEYHSPNQKYDVYLYNASLPYMAICLGVETDNFGSILQVTCNVPPGTTPGAYQLVTIAAGGDPAPGNHVAEGDFIEVRFPEDALLNIRDSSRWPPGSTITIQLFGHLPCPDGKFPCPPYQEYDVALIGGAFPSPGDVIATVQVDEFGSASVEWAIPSWLDIGTYTLVTYERDTTDPVVADTTLDIVPAEIVVQGGNEWPAGTSINVFLRGHAPNRTYSLRWVDGQSGVAIPMGDVNTDQFGSTVVPVRFTIPKTTVNSPPNHRIISFETGGSGDEVASTEVEVFTPEDAFIVVVGGNEWPAGTTIQIELHKHYSGSYDLYFGDSDTPIQTIDSNLFDDGFYQTTYSIPIATLEDTYVIRTVRSVDGEEEARIEIDVTSVPIIRLREGSVVRPGSDVTVQLQGHAPNDSYEIYLDGNLLFSMPTDPVGGGLRVYDLELLGLEGGPFVLESRKDGLMVASTEIYILSPDLQVTNIEFPPGPPINQSIPVTVTVENKSAAPISGEYFDVDLYIDPLHAPTTSSQFPPGDYKRWVNTIPATGTVQVIFNLTLRGTDHTVYGRVDTSGYIAESNEANNIYQREVSGGCVTEVTNALSSAANWTAVAYGDADIPPSTFSVSGGAMTLASDGSSNWGSSDDMYLVYYNQTISGDFEATVRITQGPDVREWAKAGLEVRSNVGSASSPKVDLAVAKSGDVSWNSGVQAGYRDGGSASRPTSGPGDGSRDKPVSYPVWLRIVRSGDRFIFYYSDSDSATPPADGAWIAHGSAQMVNMTDEVHIGLFNVSGDENVDTSSFDNFHLCLKGTEGTPPGEDFPPGLTVCTGNLIQNGGFEDPSGANWNNYGDLSATNPAHDPADPNYPFEGQRNVRMATFEDGFGWFQPRLGQTFTMPDWISSTTTINLSLYSCVTDFGTAEANDRLTVGLRSLTPMLISTQELVANGGTSNNACATGDYVHYTLDLADAIEAAGGNLENGDQYEEQTFELYFENTSNSACSDSISDPNCYESRFYLDNVELEVCTTQPAPDSHPDPGQATIEGDLRVFLSGAPTQKQGVRVWTYTENGDLLTTYSLHDSTYHFYNIDPGDYIIYSEYWDGPNLYSTFARVSVGPDETANRSLLLR